MTRSPSLVLREARADDAALVLAFIRELADYERLAHEVTATREAIAETLFGDAPAAEVLIAEWDGEPAGFALFFPNYSTFLARPGIYLEDLFVRPDYRGRGIGTALLARLAAIAVARGCGRLDWSVLDWNAPAIAFYRALGAEVMEDWRTSRLSGDALRRVAERA